MKNNDIRNIDAKTKLISSSGYVLASFSAIAPTRITVPIVFAISKNPLDSCFRISGSLPSMVRNFPSVKVPLEKYLTVSGTPIRSYPEDNGNICRPWSRTLKVLTKIPNPY